MSKEERVNEKMQQMTKVLEGMQIPSHRQRVSKSYGKEQVSKVLSYLIESSVSFEVDPLCFDVYQVSVKKEAGHLLEEPLGVNGMSFDQWIEEVDRHYVDGLSLESKEEFRDYFVRGMTPSEAIYADREDDGV